MIIYKMKYIDVMIIFIYMSYIKMITVYLLYK